MRVGACCAVLLGATGLVPTPIGSGPGYRPPAGDRSAVCRAGLLQVGARAHLELFANRRVVLVPAGIGLAAPRLRLGRVVGARCRARAWTLDPSGVVRFEPGVRLGELFAVWGEPLGPARLASFHGRTALFVNGRRRAGDPRTLQLRDRDEVVLELGGFVPPHRSFRFPP